MPPYDQIPQLAELTGAAVDGLIEDLDGAARDARRRAALQGNYAAIIAGWSAQMGLVRRRLASELMAKRVPFSKGQGLRELAASEFRALLDDSPRRALGQVTLIRSVTNTNPTIDSNFVPGVIKAGSRFKRPAAPTFFVPIQEAQYQATSDVVCGKDDTATAPFYNSDGTYTHIQVATVPVEATREGPHANTPIFASPATPTIEVVDALFDATFASYQVNGTPLLAAGGTLGLTDKKVAALCSALARVRSGPSIGAALGGSYSVPGVSHVAAGNNPYDAELRVYAGDENWATSPQFSAAVLANLRGDPPWLGFGVAAGCYDIFNNPITIEADVILRTADASVQDSVTAAISSAVNDYFNNRADWWTWRKDGLRAAIVKSDKRIIACPSAAVLSAESGFELAEITSKSNEPGLVAGGPTLAAIFHYQVVNNGVHVTYVNPGGG